MEVSVQKSPVEGLDGLLLEIVFVINVGAVDADVSAYNLLTTWLFTVGVGTVALSGKLGAPLSSLFTNSSALSFDISFTVNW